MSFLDTPHYITKEDADLYVEQVGPEDGKPIFYLHGGPGYSSYSFRDLVGDALESYQLLYADQRGSGRSYSDQTFDLNILADDVLSILSTLKIPRVSLLAHGFGAQIAVMVAKKAPERVERLILVNPWVDMPLLARDIQRAAAQLSGNPQAALASERKLPEAEALDPKALLDEAFTWVSSKTVLDAMEFPKPSSRLRLEHSDTEALFGPQLSTELDEVWSLSAKDELSDLRVATVVLTGQNDKTCYPQQVELVLERMPHALMSLLDAGHYPWLDDPETFLNLIDQALSLESG